MTNGMDRDAISLAAVEEIEKDLLDRGFVLPGQIKARWQIIIAKWIASDQDWPNPLAHMEQDSGEKN